MGTGIQKILAESVKSGRKVKASPAKLPYLLSLLAEKK